MPTARPQVRPAQWVPAGRRDPRELSNRRLRARDARPGRPASARCPHRLGKAAGGRRRHRRPRPLGAPSARTSRRIAGATARIWKRKTNRARAHIDRRIQQLTRLEHFALPLIDALGSLPSSEKWGVWLDRLMDLAQMALRQPESVLSRPERAGTHARSRPRFARRSL